MLTTPKSMWCAAVLCLIVGIPAETSSAGLAFEVENNDTEAVANLLRDCEIGAGGISPIGEVDFWKTPGTTPGGGPDGILAGDLIFAYVDAWNNGNNGDPLLRALDHDGTLIEADRDDGYGLSSVIAGAVVTEPGDVYFRISEWGNNETIAPYRLYQAVLHPSQSMMESENNDTFATADLITSPIVRGSAPPDYSDPDYFRFTARAGVSVAVIVDNDPDDNDHLTDTSLALYDADGSTTLAFDDASHTGDGNATKVTWVSFTGTYHVRVNAGPLSTDSSYRLVVLVNGVPYADADADGTSDADDNCPLFYNPAQLDTDGDGAGNECDGCPFSELKQAPGVCGCDQPDVDVNGDGVIDCNLADPARTLLAGPGLLLVTDSDNDRVMAFDPYDGDAVDLNFIVGGPTLLSTPLAAILAPDAASILVSDVFLDVVQRFDLDGNFLGTFAPAGGANPAILDGPQGMERLPDGSILVASGNLNAIVRFDAAGNFAGQFIAPGAGGLQVPSDVLVHHGGGGGQPGRLLVTDITGATVKSYDAATGAFLSDFATFDPLSDPMQLAGLSDGHLIVANYLGDDRGYLEYDASGPSPSDPGTLIQRLLPANLAGFHGVCELGNGNLLVTARHRIVNNPTAPNGGVFEIDRAGNLIAQKALGTNVRLIERVVQDADGDGTGDAIDGCPQDGAEVSLGACGCGVPDSDSDADGIADCVDICPGLNDSTDDNGDGVADCLAVLGLGPDGQPIAASAPGCCAPGVFPTVGIFTPMFLMGWKRRREQAAGGRL